MKTNEGGFFNGGDHYQKLTEKRKNLVVDQEKNDFKKEQDDILEEVAEIKNKIKEIKKSGKSKNKEEERIAAGRITDALEAKVLEMNQKFLILSGKIDVEKAQKIGMELKSIDDEMLKTREAIREII